MVAANTNSPYVAGITFLAFTFFNLGSAHADDDWKKEPIKSAPHHLAFGLGIYLGGQVAPLGGTANAVLRFVFDTCPDDASCSHEPLTNVLSLGPSITLLITGATLMVTKGDRRYAHLLYALSVGASALGLGVGISALQQQGQTSPCPDGSPFGECKTPVTRHGDALLFSTVMIVGNALSLVSAVLGWSWLIFEDDRTLQRKSAAPKKQIRASLAASSDYVGAILRAQF